MYKFFVIVWFRMKIILKSKTAIVMLFVLPIIFSVIFGSMSIEDATKEKKKS